MKNKIDIPAHERITDYDLKLDYSENSLKYLNLEQFKKLGHLNSMLPDWMKFSDWKTFMDSFIKAQE